MYFTRTDLLPFDEASFFQVLRAKPTEGVHLDYKASLTGGEKREVYKEFLKDITAFANAQGGDVLIGVDEPSEEKPVEAQIIGIASAESVAQDLERLSSGAVDPRIPDLLIVPVRLSSGKEIIMVHIPPSLSRPHMVNYQGHRAFYIRHSESSFPMTTHEVRESVLSSFSAEQAALHRSQEKETEVSRYLASDLPYFVINSVPLISFDQQIAVFDSKIKKILCDESRSAEFGNRYFSLSTSESPRACIEGVQTFDRVTDPSWILELHRSGFFHLWYKNTLTIPVGKGNPPLLHSEFKKLFQFYFDILSQICRVSNIDAPYLIVCKYLQARGSILRLPRRVYDDKVVYQRDEILWPIHFRAAGQPFSEMASLLIEELFYAFGFERVIE
jgi:hypothetical protein